MIYFVQDSRTFDVKIGFTDADTADARVAALQTGNPGQLVVLLTLPGGRADEAVLHQKFAGYRASGEWFRPGPRLMAFVLDVSRRLGRAEGHDAGWGKGVAAGLRDERARATAWLSPDTSWASPLQDPEFGPDLRVLCPVCRFDHNHVGRVVPFPFGGKWSGLAVEMACESGHHWRVCLGTHKGQANLFALPTCEAEADATEQEAVATTG